MGPLTPDGLKKESQELSSRHEYFFCSRVYLPYMTGPFKLLFSIFGVVLFNLSHHYRYPYRMYGWGYSLDVDPAADRIVPSWEAH